MSGPDRIWAAGSGAGLGGHWGSEGGLCQSSGATEYIRRDPAVLAALPEVQAMIAGAYEAAARLCWAQVKRRAEQVNSAEEGSTQRARWIAGRIQAEELAKAIEAMAPADAIAARDAMIAEAVAKEREACIAECQHRASQHESNGHHLLMREGELCAAAIRKRGEGQP